MEEIAEWYKQLNDKVKTFMKVTGFILVITICMVTFITFFYAPMRINGPSMNPALSDGDIVIIDKITYKFKEPERFDLIAFEYRYDKSQEYIKRIIGMPGETLYIADNDIYILNEETGQFEILEEYYGYYSGSAQLENCAKVTLGADEYFVIGDNRYNSDDSRSNGVGLVKRDTIIGRACFRLLPLDGFGSLKYQ